MSTVRIEMNWADLSVGHWHAEVVMQEIRSARLVQTTGSFPFGLFFYFYAPLR